MKRIFKRNLLIVTVLIALVAATGCGGGTPDPAKEIDATEPDRIRIAQVLAPGSGVTVMTAADWASDHPDIYASYMKNKNNTAQDDYVAKYPWIATLYEGMGFFKFYNSARGHVYSLEDLDATGRPHPFSNCYACKTPDLHAMINDLGDDVYQIPYDELFDQMNEPVSCFNCHANTPEEIVITHKYLADALGADLANVDAGYLACGQCHIEYYFNPATRVVTPPYTSLATMNPDSILDYFNTLIIDGKPFADYTNPRSGVRQIKVQHPEFETILGAGSEHAGTFTCADCHMGTAVNAAGEKFVDHEWTSPLKNTALLEETCSECHGDLGATVKRTQDHVKSRTKEIGLTLEALMEELVVAVESEDYTDEQLDPIRSVFRNAQFYWDFVFVENSNGAHNPTLTHQCLDKAEALAGEVKALLEKL